MPEMVIDRFQWFQVDGADVMLHVRISETKSQVYLPWFRQWRTLSHHPLRETTVLRIDTSKILKGVRR